MMPSNPHSDNLSAIHPVFLLRRVDDPKPFDPLGALLSRQHDPKYSRQTMLSPLCIAAMQNDSVNVSHIYNLYETCIQRELDLALFHANHQGHEGIATTLESYHANPGREFFANGLHGAAWAGLNCNIQRYIHSFGANPDVTDGSSATPIIYAILGTQVEEHAWATIQFLIANGASAWIKFGSEEFSYEEIAQKKGKKYLARKFKELGPCPSPTILNSSREPSCIPGECNDESNSKRPQEGSEADNGASLSCESSCTVGRDDVDNEHLREDPGVGGGASFSRESSCTVGRDDVDNEQLREDPGVGGGASFSRESSCTVGQEDDVQPNNKRPREDPEVDGGDKRARRA
ncbi:hypothetical protein FOYG_03506 [Fusarium oxysporum NRRL 32931]|uniref:Uncharacterized protein n=1 Tax=Fusarium oxysporum NRRL 32931 TaxID=660029 RepID=W9IWX8_FUSOX|nr:hypothetical protein FOYG_03506 [Fusarium oxysporum NRRL 32931]